ncbi:MAG: response regulator [Erythrobacter sp.]
MAHILIVDDDVIIAEVASEALINSGHACGWVTSGEQALKVLEHRRPDIMLLDQDMPGMTGSQVLRQLRNSPEFYDLPVIMFSAIAGKRDEELAMFAGANDYIRKPFKPNELAWRIEDILNSLGSRPKHKQLQTVLEESSGWADRAEPSSVRYL